MSGRNSATPWQCDTATTPLCAAFFPGPRFGTCPGSGEYGHGANLTSTHQACCSTWDARRAERATEREAGR